MDLDIRFCLNMWYADNHFHFCEPECVFILALTSAFTPNDSANLLPSSQPDDSFFSSPSSRHQINSFTIRSRMNRWRLIFVSFGELFPALGNQFFCFTCFSIYFWNRFYGGNEWDRKNSREPSARKRWNSISVKEEKKQLNRKKANRETILNIEYNFAMCVRFAQLFGYFNLSYKNRHMGLQLLLTTNVDSATWTFLLGWAFFTATTKSIYHFSLDLWCSERDKARERAHPLSKCDVETQKA